MKIALSYINIYRLISCLCKYIYLSIVRKYAYNQIIINIYIDY